MGRLTVAARAVFETTAPDLGGRHRLAWAYSLGALLALFLLDVILPDQIEMSVLYLFPILLITWNVGKRSGIVMAVLASVASTPLHDAVAHVQYQTLWIPFVEVVLHTIIFVAFAFVISELRRALTAEKELSRLDSLTGVANRRSFIEHTTEEVLRAARYHRPLTVAYVDIDAFKAINDERGHAKGDELLKLVATTLYNHVRRTDMVARLGGDEFAITLAETGADAARATVENFKDTLLEAVRAASYAVTFSIGVVTYVVAPATADDVIARADTLMYSVKKNGKNQVAHEVVTA